MLLRGEKADILGSAVCRESDALLLQTQRSRAAKRILIRLGLA